MTQVLHPARESIRTVSPNRAPSELGLALSAYATNQQDPFTVSQTEKLAA